MLKNSLLFVLEMLKIVVISLVIIVPIRYFLIQPFYVKGASMEPNFHDREYLIVDELTYRFNEPKRGDIVVFRYPLDPDEFFIKRIVSLPGEEIRISDEGRLIIYNAEHPDGLELEETYISRYTTTDNRGKSERVVLGEDEYFVLGDNRNASKDSRVFGPVKRQYLTGRVLLRGWPLDKIKLFETPIYSNISVSLPAENQ